MFDNLLESFFSPSQIVIVSVVAVIGVALIVLNVVLAYVFHKRGERKLYDRLLQQQRDELMKQLEDMRTREGSDTERPALLQQDFFRYEPVALKTVAASQNIKPPATEASAPVDQTVEPIADNAIEKAECKQNGVTAAEASARMSDEEALSLTETKTLKRKSSSVKSAALSVGYLSEYFGSGALVDMRVLKNKHLIGKDVGYLKIADGGCIDKPLTVEADEFSAAAVKMILLTGGRVIKRKISG